MIQIELSVNLADMSTGQLVGTAILVASVTIYLCAKRLLRRG